MFGGPWGSSTHGGVKLLVKNDNESVGAQSQVSITSTIGEETA